MPLSTLLIKRIKAAFIDYLIIIGYAMLLLFIANSITSFTRISLSTDPVKGQLTGFFTLTLPVFLYFYCSEKSKWKGTIGKKMQKIALQTPADQSRNTLIIRNFFKFLPWELAHTGVHWIIYYSAEKIEVPVWVWVILLVPQITALAYFISIISSKGVSSIYDRIAHTKIRM
ncbi:RDD family protein [Sediminibacterium sp.]|uniref:RDD family protein n=1 Tax=Sediminibacterium sp. TaxID=1917865 RepID=UPI0025E3D11D|nr:RDD family protein [Sediminibacterium sp.]MBW0179202.1 RDD family protein [Sediminibacterium sp.]